MPLITSLLIVGLAAVSLSNAASRHAEGYAACRSLKMSAGGTLVQSSGIEYNTSAHGAWNLFNSEYSPACVVFPRNAPTVQTAMKAIYEAGANYAVRAGGHTAMKGWSNVQDGVLIDFTYMNETSYEPATETITLQPGVRWDQAINATLAEGVAPVGGRQGDVGTGFLLGGGLSFLSPAYGFGADMYKELDVVLVNGDMVTATATNEYADLFRALKGGGNRFGIVTRYELDVVRTGTQDDKAWYGGTIIYSNSSVEAVLNATAHYVHSVADPNAVLLVTIGNEYANGGLITSLAAVYAFYNGTSLPPSIFGDFLSIPSELQTLHPLSYYDVANTLPSGAGAGSGWHYGASALAGEHASVYRDAWRHWANFTNAFQDELALSVIAFTPVLQPQIQAGRERGGNAISPPDGGYAAVQLSQQFAPGVESIAPDVQQGIDLLFSQVPRSRGKPLFMNECDKHQDVYSTYGDYEWLKKTYAKYDPARFIVNHMEGPIGL